MDESEKRIEKKQEKLEDENGNFIVSHINDEHHPTTKDFIIVPSVLILIIFFFNFHFFIDPNFTL